MRPGTLGRALGIGARLAAKKILPPEPPPPTPEQMRVRSAERVRQGEVLGRHVQRGARVAKRNTEGVTRGSRNFGRAVWNPFARASNILWLEITGLFFLLFAAVFAQHLWTIRMDYRTGPEHGHFLMYAAFTLLFLYFALSSFARSRRRTREGSR